jgi:acetyl-CoA C-acetyltransferase
MASPRLADPLKVLDCSPRSDGACALILAGEDRVRDSKQAPAWIKGMGHAADWHYLGDRNLADPLALTTATRRAYGQAGITKPLEEIDFFEIYDAYTYMEPLWLEGLGLCSPGEGGRLTREGKTQADGPHPVNVSGGVMSAHAVLVAGLVRVGEAALQIQGNAGERQLDRVRVGLAHGINGPCGQSHCVLVLGREP